MRAVAGHFFNLRLWLEAIHQRIHWLDDEEENDGRDHEKADQRVDEVPLAKLALVDREREFREVGLTADRRDQGNDETLDQRRDDRAERRADDDCDRKIDHVATQDECSEVAEHAPFLSLDTASQDAQLRSIVYQRRASASLTGTNVGGVIVAVKSGQVFRISRAHPSRRP